jgi:uncharacterized protein YlxP (DUF503 family)
MAIGILTLELQLPACTSLKEKRRRLKPLLTRLHREFNLSVAEIARMDVWDQATLGCALISNDGHHAQSALQVVIHWIEQNWPDVTIFDDHIELIT